MRLAIAVLPILLAPGLARADLCDYRLTSLASRPNSPAVEAARAAAPVADPASPMLYLMIDPLTGETSAGVTGDARAPDQNLLMRTARLLGAAVAIVGRDSPLSTVGGAVAGAGLELVCQFRDERITEYDEVLGVLRQIDLTMPPDLFAVIEPGLERRDALLRLSRNDGFAPSEYRVDDLYIVNGQLLHREWGLNAVVGDIAIFLPTPQAE